MQFSLWKNYQRHKNEVYDDGWKSTESLWNMWKHFVHRQAFESSSQAITPRILLSQLWPVLHNQTGSRAPYQQQNSIHWSLVVSVVMFFATSRHFVFTWAIMCTSSLYRNKLNETFQNWSFIVLIFSSLGHIIYSTYKLWRPSQYMHSSLSSLKLYGSIQFVLVFPLW